MCPYNLVRNSAALCGDLVTARALEALMDLATSPTSLAEADGAPSPKGGASDGQSPLKIALFSLGNLCTHRECRDRLLALGFEAKVRRFRLNG